MATAHAIRATDIAAAHIEFQGEAVVLGGVPGTVLSLLNTQAFPMSAPPSIRTVSDYKGMKITFMDGWFCFCWFFNDNQTDGHGRPIPSARVLLLQREPVGRGARQLLDYQRLLANHDLRTATHEQVVAAVQRMHDGAPAAGSIELARPRSFHRMALSKALARVTRHKQLVLCVPERERHLEYLQPLFQLAPMTVLEKTSWCSYAFSTGDRHEDIVVVQGAVPRTPRPSWKSRLLRVFSGSRDDEGDATLDVTNARMRGGRPGHKNERFLRVLATEYVQASRHGNGKGVRRRALLSSLLEREAREGPVDPIQAIPPELRDPASKAYVKRLVKTAREAR